MFGLCQTIVFISKLEWDMFLEREIYKVIEIEEVHEDVEQER